MLTRHQVRALVSDCRARVAPRLADGHAAAAGAFAAATRMLEDALCAALPDDPPAPEPIVDASRDDNAEEED